VGPNPNGAATLIAFNILETVLEVGKYRKDIRTAQRGVRPVSKRADRSTRAAAADGKRQPEARAPLARDERERPATRLGDPKADRQCALDIRRCLECGPRKARSNDHASIYGILAAIL
jgi:hypothetical protein